MSVIVANNVQVGQSGTATNNFTLYQPLVADGTVRLANGNTGSTTDLITVTSAGNVGIGTSNINSTLTVKAQTGQGVPLLLSSTDAGANPQVVFDGIRRFQVGTGNTSSGFANNLFVYDGTSAAVVLQQGRSGYSLALQGSNPVAGTGITFPATQNASSNANTLDDYEEGTFALTCTSSSGTIGSYTSSGYYTKVGRMVYCNFYIIVSNAGTAAGQYLNFSGLPFATATSGFPFEGFFRENSSTGFMGMIGTGNGDTTGAMFYYNNNGMIASNNSYICTLYYPVN